GQQQCLFRGQPARLDTYFQGQQTTMTASRKVLCLTVLLLLSCLWITEAAPQNGNRRRNGRRRNGGGNRGNNRRLRNGDVGRHGYDQDGFGRYGRDVSHVLAANPFLP
ncbi:unnamed protein product, partial [Meganyctiphanes norvegica]